MVYDWQNNPKGTLSPSVDIVPRKEPKPVTVNVHMVESEEPRAKHTTKGQGMAYKMPGQEIPTGEQERPKNKPHGGFWKYDKHKN